MSHQFKKCLVWSLFIVNVLFSEQHKMSQRAELLAIVEKEDAEAVVQFLKNVSKSRTGSFFLLKLQWKMVKRLHVCPYTGWNDWTVLLKEKNETYTYMYIYIVHGDAMMYAFFFLFLVSMIILQI